MKAPVASGLPALARLALRRAWSPARIALSVLVLAPFVAWSLAADAGVTDALERALSADALAELRRHAARQGLWTVALVWLLSLFVVHGARAIGGLRDDDLAWRASRPPSPAAHVATSFAGLFAGLAIALVLAAAAVELTTGPRAGGRPTWREVGALAGPDTRWIGGAAALRWSIDDPGRGAHVAAIDVRVAAGGPLLDVAWNAQGRSGVERVRGRRTLEIPFEGGRGPLVVELAGASADGAPPAVGLVTREGPRGPRLWRAGADGPGERAASASVLARALAAGAAWLALALGLGAWVGAGTAATLTLTLLAAVSFGDAPRWIPAAALPRALEVAGEGRVPAAFAPGELAGAAAATLAGLALAASGLRGWRRPA